MPTKELTSSISLDELSKGYCLAIANSYRLVEDGEKLFAAKRFLAAVASCCMAVDEILKGHLMFKAAAFDEDDKEKWGWFWKVYLDRQTKLTFLEEDIHPTIFKNKKDEKAYAHVIPVFREEFIGVWYSPDRDQFMTPGHILSESPDQKALARSIYEYVLSLYKALNIHGLPKPWATLEVFRHIREQKPLKSPIE